MDLNQMFHNGESETGSPQFLGPSLVNSVKTSNILMKHPCIIIRFPLEIGIPLLCVFHTGWAVINYNGDFAVTTFSPHGYYKEYHDHE